MTDTIMKTFKFNRAVWNTFERGFFRRRAKGENITLQGEIEKLIDKYNKGE